MNPVLQWIETLALVVWCGLLALPLVQVWIAYSLETDSVQTTWFRPRQRAYTVLVGWRTAAVARALQRRDC